MYEYQNPFSLARGRREQDYLSRVEHEIENARRRLGYVGYGEEAKPKKSESFLTKIFDTLHRFERAGAGAVSEIISPELGQTPGEFDPLAAFVRGFKGEEKITPREIAEYYGFSDKPLFDVSLGGMRVSPSPAGIAGFIGTVLNPFDPINWLTFGVGGAAGRAAGRIVTKEIPLLERAFGKELAGKIVETAGSNLANVRGGTVGELVGNILRQAERNVATGKLAAEELPYLRDLLFQGIKEAGGAGKRLPIPQREITMGLSVPIVNRRIIETAIPGTKPIVTGVSGLVRRAAETPMGEALGRAFSTKFVAPAKVKDVWKTLRPLEGGPQRGTLAPSVEELVGGVGEQTIKRASPEEIGEDIYGAIRGVEDTVRHTLEGHKRVNELIMREIPEHRRVMLARELSPEGKLTPYLEARDYEGAKNALKLNDLEVTAADMFHRLRKSIIKELRGMGLEIEELPSWVAHIFTRPPTEKEAAVIRLAFGERIAKSLTADDTIDSILFEIASKHYPHLKERVLTSGALSPHAVNEVLREAGLKPLLVEDLYTIMSTVQERFIRAKAAVTHLKNIRNHYGLTPEQLRAYGFTHLPEGYGIYKIEVDPRTGKAGFKEVSPTEQQEFIERAIKGSREEQTIMPRKPKGVGETGKEIPVKQEDIIAFPEEMARVWNDYMELHFNTMERNAFLRFFDKATSIFRTLAYMVTPGHIPRDFASNNYNLWLMGMRDPRYISEGWSLSQCVEKDIILNVTETPRPSGDWLYLVENEAGRLIATESPTSMPLAYIRRGNQRKVLQLLNKTVKTPEGEITYFDVLDKASSKGVLDTGWWRAEGPQIGVEKLKPLHKRIFTLDPTRHPYTQSMVTLTKRVDNSSRLAGFLHNLEKGYDVGESAARVKMYLFDYADLTPFERKWMRRIIPFYTWMRKNIPLQIKEAFKQPGKISTAGKYHREAPSLLGIEEEQKPGEVPSFLEESAAIKLGDWYVIPPLSYQDLARFTGDWRDVGEMLSSINPLLRVIPELAANRQFFAGLPIERYPGERSEGFLGTLGIPFISQKRGFDYLWKQIPLLRNIATIAPALTPTTLMSYGIPEEPEVKAQSKGVSRLMSFLGGPPVFGEQRAREIATYEERDRLRALIRMLKDMGIEVPGIRELPY